MRSPGDGERSRLEKCSRDTDLSTEAARWQWVLDHWVDLRRLCRRSCGRRLDLLEEMCSDVVVARVPRILELYDPTMGPLWGKVRKDVLWYCYKFKRRGAKILRREASNELLRHRDRELPDQHVVESIERNEDPYGDQRVQELLIVLPEQLRSIVFMHDVMGLRFRDIAEELDSSKSVVLRRYHEAMRILRG
jgi:RNA polymerase sigma factor (sigma-70 family)